MLNLKVKPANRNRIIAIFLIGALSGGLGRGGFHGLFVLLIDGGLMLIVAVMIGNVANYLLSKLGIRWGAAVSARDTEGLLDMEEPPMPDVEAEKDRAALNYGIVWALFSLLLNFF
ncbi:MAG: hypothetical protein KDD06_26770 [Phaeodactylibacter sp.]|nr:hypothetical protein [Phaeodactylibacter sp.]MCB9266094.1 hypothetical protein [Lewinellaceae bacterium]MCB9289279.1 hypothetical protein [Lewinellaceae bacterium]